MSAAHLEVRPSPRFAALIFALHCGAALAAWRVLPGVPGGALAAALLALGAVAAWNRALLRSRGSPRVLELDGERLSVGLAGGGRLEGRTGARRWVSRYGVALPAGDGLARRTILVTSDMLEADSFRLLRLWALWGRTPARAPAVAGKQLQA